MAVVWTKQSLETYGPIAAHMTFGTRFHKLFFVGMIISFIGVIIAITSDGVELDASPLGIVLMMLGVFSYVSFSVFIKKLTVDYSNTTIVLYTNIVGGILLFIAFALFEWDSTFTVEHSFSSTLAILLIGVFSSFLGYITYTQSIKVLGVGNAMMFFNLVPVVAALGSFIFLGEDISGRKLIGMFIVIIGLYLTMINPKKKGSITAGQ